MVQAFLAGAIAGYAIAIPVGAIGILIIDTGMRRGFRHGFAAGAGAATADLVYAALAVLAGTAVAALLAPIQVWLRVVAVAALAWIGIRGLAASLRSTRTIAEAGGGSPVATWLRFLGLTILNPATIIYFAALILGLGDYGAGPAERTAFVVGAGVASLSWQTVLAVLGAVGHRRLPHRVQEGISIAGNLLILGFAASIALSLAR